MSSTVQTKKTTSTSETKAVPSKSKKEMSEPIVSTLLRLFIRIAECFVVLMLAYCSLQFATFFDAFIAASAGANGVGNLDSFMSLRLAPGLVSVILISALTLWLITKIHGRFNRMSASVRRRFSTSKEK